VDAPDTLIELHDGGRVEETSFADYGIKTIAGKTYEGVSMRVDRGGDLVGTLPRLAINTKGRYKRMTGVVGILGDAQCTNNDANVSITNGSGERLWGPFRGRLIREEESSPDLGARGVFFVFAVSSTRYHR